MEEYDIRTRTSSVGAACALVVIASNLISLVTTGIGLKESFFEEKTVLNLLFVGGLSLVIQLTKAALERLPKKGVKLTVIYVVALVLSSLFSAQSMVLAAYPAERFAAAAQQTITSKYTEQLLDIQDAVGDSLTAARDGLWKNLEAVRASLDTVEGDLDAEKMLAKYRGQTSDGFDPMSDTSYLALEAALDDVANKDFEAAKAEVDNALAALDAEDNETAKAKVAQDRANRPAEEAQGPDGRADRCTVGTADQRDPASGGVDGARGGSPDYPERPAAGAEQPGKGDDSGRSEH